jgi:putative endonuclease
MAEQNLFGKEGEKRALDYLTSNDFILLRKNYRFRKAEVDLLIQKDDLLICV